MLQYLGNRSADEHAKKGAGLGRIAERDRLVVAGCHELARLLFKFCAEQEARIGDSKMFDHVPLDWLRTISFDVPDIQEDDIVNPTRPPEPPPPPPPVAGGEAGGRGTSSGSGPQRLVEQPLEEAPARAEWPDMHVWPARKHAIIEAPVSDPSGIAAGSIALCTSCGGIANVGGHWGRSSLASDCPGARSSGRERQLACILRGAHPSKKGFRVGTATPLSQHAQEFSRPKMGLDDSSSLVPPGDLAVGVSRSVMGVDLVRGLALFGFPSRAAAEALGARAFERRRSAAQAPLDETEFP